MQTLPREQSLSRAQTVPSSAGGWTTAPDEELEPLEVLVEDDDVDEDVFGFTPELAELLLLDVLLADDALVSAFGSFASVDSAGSPEERPREGRPKRVISPFTSLHPAMTAAAESTSGSEPKRFMGGFNTPKPPSRKLRGARRSECPSSSCRSAQKQPRSESGAGA